MKRSEFTAALVTTLLTEKLNALGQSHKEYEQLYTGKTNNSSIKVVPSDLRKELADAIKDYMDEVNMMASEVDTAEWYSLCVNLQNRFDEVNVAVVQKSKTDAPASEIPTTPAA